MTDLLAAQECILHLVRALPERPQRVRLVVAGVTIEIDWPGPSGQPPVATAAAAGAAGEASLAEDGPSPGDPGDHVVCSPGVGTFYGAPEPGAPPFVAEGDLVEAGQQVAILEAMKLMLPVEAELSGRVTKILRNDGDQVEYGEPLMALAPAGQAAG